MLAGITWQRTPLTVPVVVAALVAAGVAAFAWRHREEPGGRALVVLLAGATAWSLAGALALAARPLWAKLLANKLIYVGAVWVPVAWVWFAGAYTGHDWFLSRRSLAALSVVPAVTLVLALTNHLHGLVWVDPYRVQVTGLGTAFQDVEYTHGGWFYVWTTYAYLLVAAGAGLLVWTLATTDDHYRDQAAAVLLACAVPLGAHVAWLLGFGAAPNLTPVAFVVSGVALTVAALRHRLLDLSPAARELGRDEVIASMDDAVVLVDDDRRVIDCNPRAAALSAAAPDEVAGAPVGVAFPWLAGVLSAPVPDRTETEVNDDEDRHYDVRVSDLDERGPLGGWVVTLRDVTDRKRRERELERYQKILDTVGDLVYALDDDGNIVGVNDTAVEVSGYDRDRLLGSHISMLMEPGDVERGQELIEELLADPDRENATFEMDLITADGERIHCENHVALLPREGEEFHGTVGILRDVTEQRRRGQQLNVLNRVLRHDLRNDVNLIIGNAELLASDPEDAEEYVEEIRSKARGMIARSNRIRRIERTLEEGPDDEGPIEVVGLVEDRIDALAGDYPNVRVDTDLPDAAWASGTELVAVAVDNALENVVVHNDEDPRVRVSVGVERDQVVVAVADNGPGIPRKERRTLQRQRETPLEHTSGLGLWTIHWVVDQCGGTLEFEENQPRGSVVRIRLPLAGPPASETGPGAPATEGEGDGPPTGSNDRSESAVEDAGASVETE